MRPHKTWHNAHDEKLSFGDRVADKVAAGMGSWAFIIAMTVFIAVWIAMNIVGVFEHWDPFPFILLNLVFSAQATYAAPLIMMAQNRQSDRDREQAQQDYECNVAAKAEIEDLIVRLGTMEDKKIDKLIEWVGALVQAEQQRREREKLPG
jgi:uncharacterized membrane protein